MPENENTGELHESPLDPAEDERIRRLLADARHTEPMPDAGVARLDRVLSGLSDDRTERADRADRADRAEVVDLVARRRRTVGQLLVAAAAVVAVGFGITLVLPHLGGGSGGDAQETTAGGAAADSAEAGDGEGSRFVSPESAPEAPSDGATGGAAKSTFRISSDVTGPAKATGPATPHPRSFTWSRGTCGAAPNGGSATWCEPCPRPNTTWSSALARRSTWPPGRSTLPR